MSQPRTSIIFFLPVLCMLLAAQCNPMDFFKSSQKRKTKDSLSISVKEILPEELKIKPIREPASQQKPDIYTTETRSLLPTTMVVHQTEKPPAKMKLFRNRKGNPIFIKLKNSFRSKNKKIKGKKNIEKICKDELKELKGIIPIEHPDQELEIVQTDEDVEDNVHVKLVQSYQGIPVYGSHTTMHLSPEGQMIFNGRYSTTPRDVDLSPKLSKTDVISLCTDSTRRRRLRQKDFKLLTESEKEFLNWDGPEAKLIIYPDDSYVENFRLAYRVELYANFATRYDYIVDAHSGEIIRALETSCDLGPSTIRPVDLNGNRVPITTFDRGRDYLMVDITKKMFRGNPQSPARNTGIIQTATVDAQGNFQDLTSSNNNWNAIAVSAHYNASMAYDYFQNTFGWNSIDGKGMDILSVVNYDFENAYWNGRAILYGNGGDNFKPLAGSLDVGGHEMAHGVIQATADLEYNGESGALNESFADIFGAMIDRDDWQIGEEIVNPNVFTGGALRNMANPANGCRENSICHQPDHYKDRYVGSFDNGGVHINSGINNKAFVLVANATGKSNAEQIYFRALRFYLTETAQFLDMRLAAVQAAIDLFGDNSAQERAIHAAYDAVGVFDPDTPVPPTNPDPTPDPTPKPDPKDPVEPDTIPPPPTIVGTEFILSTDMNGTDPNTIYVNDPPNQKFLKALSQSGHQSRVSITADGKSGYFAGNDKHIHRIVTDPSQNPNEEILSTEPMWRNVAVSRDGRLLAALSTNYVPEIIVFNLITGDGRRFDLVNPPASDGRRSGAIKYAEGIQWDHKGEYILFDALNEIRLPDNSREQYYDMALLRAWDPFEDSFGDGLTQRIFSRLPKGVNIGNASFAHQSPAIVTFDLVDVKSRRRDDDEYYIMAANIETGVMDTIYRNFVVSDPYFSVNDDKIIFNTENSNSLPIIATIDLKPNKISSVPRSTKPLIGAAKWPVWYIVGEPSPQASTDATSSFIVQQSPPLP